MARSQKDDPAYADMQHHWNYHPDVSENCVGNVMNEKQQPHATNAGIPNDTNLFGNPNVFTKNERYHPYNICEDNNGISDDNIPFSNIQNIKRVNNLQNYGALNLGNGQLVRVYYDENNRQFMIPVSGQYEHFNNPGIKESAPQNSQQPTHIFANQDYTINNNLGPTQASNLQNSQYGSEHINMQNSNVGTSSFLKEVLGNWVPNSTGTYSPFGQNFPLNHPDAPTTIIHSNNNPMVDVISPNIPKPEMNSHKRNENSPLADTSNKKRIVAEVKPMRPSYSDVLAKNTKNNTIPDTTRKAKSSINVDNNSNKPAITKLEKQSSNIKQASDESKPIKHDNKDTKTMSSGSDSGDVNMEDTEKHSKSSKKNRNKRSNMSRKWSSLDDLNNDDNNSNFNHGESNMSQFVFIENQTDKKKDRKSKSKQTQKGLVTDDNLSFEDEDDNSFIAQEGQIEGTKARKKKEPRTYSHKLGKLNQDKKKPQAKAKRNKHVYLCIVQGYLGHWGEATWKAIVWFMYLLSDICRMSAHLSFDLCTSIFTQTYVSCQTVWRSCKDWVYKLKDNKFLLFIDKKLGHTKFGFWRKLKWFNKDNDNGSDNKLNANIPLPATGEEAMKRLLACKGKDPYSILGVSVSCTDEDIKRYYRRQAFLVHPDKNQQPGAEEAFKILQHAFDLIGEPERREEYARRTLESQHAEAAWSELSTLLAQLHDKMEVAANTIRCTNCGRRHKRVATDRPCYAARYCAQCKIRHSAKEGDIWAESSMMGFLVMYYACMDGAVYQITQWASCQKRNLRQLRPDCHVVQYRIVLGNKAAAPDLSQKTSTSGHDPNLEEFLNNLYNKSSGPPSAPPSAPPPAHDSKPKKRTKKTKS